MSKYILVTYISTYIPTSMHAYMYIYISTYRHECMCRQVYIHVHINNPFLKRQLKGIDSTQRSWISWCPGVLGFWVVL